MRLAIRQQFVLAALLAVVPAVVVGALLLVGRRGAEATEFSAARLVPADVPLFIGLDTDLTHPQWVAAFNLARALGEADPEGSLRSLVLEEGDLDWERDVAPFRGGDAALYLRSFDIERGVTVIAFIIRCVDVARAEAVIADRSDTLLVTERYEGVEYRPGLGAAGQEGFLARIDDYLVLATDRETLFAVMDVDAGRRSSFADAPEYATLREQLADDLLVYSYMHVGRLVEIGAEALAGSGFVLGPPGTGLTEAGAAAFGFTARKGAFELRAVGPPVTGVAAEPYAARASRFVQTVPAGTLIFATTHGIDGSGFETVGALDLLGLGGGVDGLGGPLAGLDLPVDPDDVVALLALARGELVVAASAEAGFEKPQAVLLAEVRDEAAVRRLLDRIVPALAGARPRTQTVSGVPMYVVDSPAGELAYTVTAGFFAVGTQGSVRSALAAGGRKLDDSAAYQRALLEIDTSLGSYLYLDLQGLLAAFAGELPAGAEAFARAARSLVVNAVQEGGASHVTAAFLVQE